MFGDEGELLLSNELEYKLIKKGVFFCSMTILEELREKAFRLSHLANNVMTDEEFADWEKFVPYLADLSLLEISLIELCMSTRIFMNRMKTEIIN